MRKLRVADWLAINAYWFGLGFMWSSLHPILLPAVLLRFVSNPATKNTWLGVLTFFGLVLAMIVQPISGAISDRLASRWGRRRPLILVGTLFDLVFLAVLALAGGLPALFAGYILLQLSSNTAHGPGQGLIPDIVPAEQRGSASGIKSLFDMGGLVVASLLMGRLVNEATHDARPAFVAIAAVLVVTLLITLLGVREQPSHGAGSVSIRDRLRETFRVDVRGNPDYARLVLARFLILVGIFAVQSFAQYFVRDVLVAALPARTTANLMAAIGVCVLLAVYPSGYLADRFGRKPLNIAAGALTAASLLGMVFVRSQGTLLIMGGLAGFAMGIFLTSNWTWATDLVPTGEAGKYLGLSNLATAGAGATARLGGPLIDGVNALAPGAYLGYSALFVIGGLAALVGTLLLRRVPEGRAARGRAAAHG